MTFRDDADNSQGGPGGRQRRQISPTAEPQQRPKRPRTDRTQIFTILPPTERARLAPLSVHTNTAEAVVSSSSAAPSHTRTSGTTPRPHGPSAAPHTAAPISGPSAHPSRDGGPTTAPRQRPECPHGPQHTPAYAARGAQDCETGATAVSVTPTPPVMAAQVPLSDPDDARAESLPWPRCEYGPRAQCCASRTGPATRRQTPVKQ